MSTHVASEGRTEEAVRKETTVESRYKHGHSEPERNEDIFAILLSAVLLDSDCGFLL